MKKIIFWLFALLAVSANAQPVCPNIYEYNQQTVLIAFQTDASGAVTAVSGSFCREIMIVNKIKFTFLGLPTNGIEVDFSDPSNPPGTFVYVTPLNNSVTITYPPNTTAAATMTFLTFRPFNATFPPTPGSGMFASSTNSFLLNPIGTSGNYASPDDVWHITTSATFSPPIQGAFPINTYFSSSTVASADACIRYNPAHLGRMVKPLIFVDGLDFGQQVLIDKGKVIRHGSTGWDVLWAGNTESRDLLLPAPNNGSEFKNYPEGLSRLMNEGGYDIIFLDFAVGTDYIEKNSLLLEALLERVRDEKIADADGTIWGNVVVGASMGGMIARHCLARMEKEGKDHCTSTYVSFDAPQQGANIPLGLQAAVLFSKMT